MQRGPRAVRWIALAVLAAALAAYGVLRGVGTRQEAVPALLQHHVAAPPPAPASVHAHEAALPPQLLQLPGAESERLLTQLLVPLLRRSAPRASGSDERALGVCRLGSSAADAAPCVAPNGTYSPSMQLVVAPEVVQPRPAVGHAASPLLIVLLRHPIEALIAAFNGRPPHAWPLAPPLATNFTPPLEVFRRVYPVHLAGRAVASCLLAGERAKRCAEPPAAEHAALQVGWLRRARARLRSSQLILWPEYEAGKVALCRTLLRLGSLREAAAPRGADDAFCASTPRQLPLALGSGGDGEGDVAEREAPTEATSGCVKSVSAMPGCGSSAVGSFLSFEALRAERGLISEVRAKESTDLKLYTFAQQLQQQQRAAAAAPPSAASAAGTAPPSQDAVATTNRTATLHGLKVPTRRCVAAPSGPTLCPDPVPPIVPLPRDGRVWADDFAQRIPRLQNASPPTRQRTLLFTHIPKCAGSSFRNNLLLEYTRLHRSATDFACVLYKDIGVREKRANSSMIRQGPACIAADGLLKPQLIVVTGHIAFHPKVLARFRSPFTAIVFLREPISRLVSLFNMYPDGTFGASPANASAVAKFADAYRRRFVGRNALTCFISGSVLCDSVGSVTSGAIDAASLRRARFNLNHRYALFGLTERSEESLAIISWALGWLPFYKSAYRTAGTGTGTGGRALKRLAPGRHHRRLGGVSSLCAVPGLLEEMQLAERPDLLLYRFARALYAQRLAHVPREVLELAPPPPPPPEASAACSADPPAAQAAPPAARATRASHGDDSIGVDDAAIYAGEIGG